MRDPAKREKLSGFARSREARDFVLWIFIFLVFGLCVLVFMIANHKPPMLLLSLTWTL